MKPLPDEDAALSARIWASNWSTVEQTPPSGHGVESAAEARAFYVDYVTRLPNSWLREGDLARWDLVVDPAAGAWSGVAAQVLEELSPLSVREVNALGGGRVNENGGVGRTRRQARRRGGRTPNSSPAIQGARALFEAGRARREELLRGDGPRGGLRSRRRRRQGLHPRLQSVSRRASRPGRGRRARLAVAFPERRR